MQLLLSQLPPFKNRWTYHAYRCLQ